MLVVTPAMVGWNGNIALLISKNLKMNLLTSWPIPAASLDRNVVPLVCNLTAFNIVIQVPWNYSYIIESKKYRSDRIGSYHISSYHKLCWIDISYVCSESLCSLGLCTHLVHCPKENINMRGQLPLSDPVGWTFQRCDMLLGFPNQMQ